MKKQLLVIQFVTLATLSGVLGAPVAATPQTTPPPVTAGVSFDCKKAATPTEKAICATPELSNLDGQVSQQFKQARTVATVPVRQALLDDQLKSLKERDQCGSNVACLKSAMETRLKVLVAFSDQANSDDRTRGGNTARLTIEASLAEFNTRFTVRGHPVHPGLIEKFTRWLSDSGGPVVLTVDVLAAAGSNEYFDDQVKMETNLRTVEREPGMGRFSYEWLGTVAPGLHVVRTSESGGGSGVFEDLYVLRASAGTGQGEEGPYSQLLLTVVRFVTLGDRDDGVVTVRPNTITIGKSRYRDKPVTLHFD